MIVVNLTAWNCNDTPLHNLTCYFLAQPQHEFVLGLAAQKSHTSPGVHSRRLWKWRQVYSVFPMRWQSFRQKQHFIVWRHKERAASPSPTLRRNNRAALKEARGIGRRKRIGLMWALRFIHMCSRDSSFVITCCCRSERENESRDRDCGDKPSFWEPLDYHKDPSEYWEGSGRAAGGTEDLKCLAVLWGSRS